MITHLPLLNLIENSFINQAVFMWPMFRCFLKVVFLFCGFWVMNLWYGCQMRNVRLFSSISIYRYSQFYNMLFCFLIENLFIIWLYLISMFGTPKKKFTPRTIFFQILLLRYCLCLTLKSFDAIYELLVIGLSFDFSQTYIIGIKLCDIISRHLCRSQCLSVSVFPNVLEWIVRDLGLG